MQNDPKGLAIRDAIVAAHAATAATQSLAGTLIAFAAMPEMDALALPAIRRANAAAARLVETTVALLEAMQADVATRPLPGLPTGSESET